MQSPPERRKGESWLAFYERMNVWERQARIDALKESRQIDTYCARPKHTQQGITTRQTIIDRMSIHDLVQASPANSALLRNVARRMQEQTNYSKGIIE